MFEKTYMRFDLKNNKEYIYSRDVLRKEESFVNSIGKTFIDFLANSEDIIKVIEKEVYSYHKNDTLRNATIFHTLTKLDLEKLNVFFKYFDFDSYIQNYIKNLRNKNNMKIQECLEKIQEFENDIKYYKSAEYYNDTLKEEISSYHDYDSKESKKGFYYINKAEKEVNEKIKKFTDIYGCKPSYNAWDKIYSKNKNALKGDAIIEKIEKRIYNEHKDEIEQNIIKDIKRRIKQEKDLIDSYKNDVKYYVKNNERALNEVFEEYINIIKFWVNFSKYILINFYNLSSEKYDSNFSANQRLLDFLLHVERTYYNKNIFEIPNSNITLELVDRKNSLDLNDFIRDNVKELLHYNNNIYERLNTYNVNIVQEYEIRSIEDFISISVIQILQNNIKLCRCENCDKLFISVNKSNEKYCMYRFKDKKTCRDLSYSIHLQKNELSNILRKKYRTENAKKNRNQHIPKVEEKFQNWYMKAKEQKEFCEKGMITINDFNKWFEDNKKWF